MKKSFWNVLLLLIMLVIFVGGIAGFVALYNEIPEITDTKLQLFTFDRLEGQTICCSDGKKVNIKQCSFAYFDDKQFINEIQQGDHIFVRVSNVDLSNESENFDAFAVLSEKGEYLSMENVSLALAKQNETAYVCLIFGIVFAVVMAAVMIFLQAARKKK